MFYRPQPFGLWLQQRWGGHIWQTFTSYAVQKLRSQKRLGWSVAWAQAWKRRWTDGTQRRRWGIINYHGVPLRRQTSLFYDETAFVYHFIIVLLNNGDVIIMILLLSLLYYCVFTATESHETELPTSFTHSEHPRQTHPTTHSEINSRKTLGTPRGYDSLLRPTALLSWNYHSAHLENEYTAIECEKNNSSEHSGV